MDRLLMSKGFNKDKYLAFLGKAKLNDLSRRVGAVKPFNPPVGNNAHQMSLRPRIETPNSIAPNLRAVSSKLMAVVLSDSPLARKASSMPIVESGSRRTGKPSTESDENGRDATSERTPNEAIRARVTAPTSEAKPNPRLFTKPAPVQVKKADSTSKPTGHKRTSQSEEVEAGLAKSPGRQRNKTSSVLDSPRGRNGRSTKGENVIPRTLREAPQETKEQSPLNSPLRRSQSRKNAQPSSEPLSTRNTNVMHNPKTSSRVKNIKNEPAKSDKRERTMTKPSPKPPEAQRKRKAAENTGIGNERAKSNVRERPTGKPSSKPRPAQRKRKAADHMETPEEPKRKRTKTVVSPVEGLYSLRPISPILSSEDESFEDKKETRSMRPERPAKSLSRNVPAIYSKEGKQSTTTRPKYVPSLPPIENSDCEDEVQGGNQSRYLHGRPGSRQVGTAPYRHLPPDLTHQDQSRRLVDSSGFKIPGIPSRSKSPMDKTLRNCMRLHSQQENLEMSCNENQIEYLYELLERQISEDIAFESLSKEGLSTSVIPGPNPATCGSFRLPYMRH